MADLDQDMTDDEVDSEEQAARPAKPATRIPSTVHLARLALARCVTQSMFRDIRSGAIRSIVIEAPSVSWIPNLVSAARRTFSDVDVLAIHEKSRFQTGDGALHTLAIDRPVIGISQNPDDLLPRSMILSCDLRITIKLDAALVYKLARTCLRGRVGIQFVDLDTTGFDFFEICACVATGSHAKHAYRRLKRAIANKRQASRLGDDVPSLDQVHGYGEAQLWAIDLQRDLADLKSGRISPNDADRGCVLFGPSGTGKTLLARVIARACGVPFFAVSMGDFFRKGDGHLGNVLQAIRGTFEQAQAQSPAILFIDELDSFPHRAQLSSHNRDWWTSVVNELLVLLDGSAEERNGLVVIGATNSLDGIDDALLRKGRLERAIYIGPPDEAALQGILRHYLGRELPHVDLAPLVQSAVGATGADVEEWVRAARRRARRADRAMIYEDLAAQILLPDTRSAAQKQRIAVHEAGHAVAVTLLSVDLLERVTIVRTKSSGGHTSIVRRLQDVSLRSDLEDIVVCLLAGRAAEFIVTGEHSTAAGGSAQSDLALATNVIATWHVSLGLAERISWYGPPDQTLTVLAMDPKLRLSVDNDLARLSERAVDLMRTNRPMLDAVATSLVKERTLSGSAVRQIMAEAGGAKLSVLNPGEPLAPS